MGVPRVRNAFGRPRLDPNDALPRVRQSLVRTWLGCRLLTRRSQGNGRLATTDLVMDAHVFSGARPSTCPERYLDYRLDSSNDEL